MIWCPNINNTKKLVLMMKSTLTNKRKNKMLPNFFLKATSVNPAIISHHKRNLHMFSTRTILFSKQNVANYKKTNLLIPPSHTSSKTLMLQQTFLFFQNLNIYLSFLITYNENKPTHPSIPYIIQNFNA